MAKALSCLLVTIQSEEGAIQKVVNQSPFLIGRTLECAIAFPGLNVSRQHVLVKNRGNKVWIEDQDSANGTYLNGKRLESKRWTPTEPGDQIRLGVAGVQMTIVIIPVAFHESVLTDGVLGKEDRDSTMNLIQGAHAEATRLVELGREVHDNFVKSGEEKAASIEKKMAANYEQVMEEAKHQVRAILEKAKSDHDKLVDSAEQDAVAAARAATEKITIEAQLQGERMIEDAKRLSAKKLEEGRIAIEEESRERRVKSAAEAEAFFEQRRTEITAIQTKQLNDVDDYRKQQEEEAKAIIAQKTAEFEKRKATADTKLAEINNEVGLRKDELRAISDRRDTLDRDLEFSQEELKLVEKQLASHQKHLEEVERLAADLKKSMAEVQDLETKRDTLQAQVRQLSEQIVASEQDLTKRSAALAAETDARKDEIRDLSERREKLDRDLESREQKLKSVQEHLASEQEEVADLEEQAADLKKLLSEVNELEAKRKALGAQAAKLTEQIATSEQTLAKQMAENQSTIESDGEKRRKKQDEELTALRVAEMERLKRDRATAMAEIARERQRLGQKILIEVETAAVKTMPVETWRSAMKDVEHAIRENLEVAALTESSDDSISPLISQIAKQQRRARVGWGVQGLFAGMLILFGAGKAMDQMRKDDDPSKSAAEQSTQQAKEDLERRKFNPEQDDQWRDTYAGLVIYNRDFVAKYQAEDFQKVWLKEASSYFLKKWKVPEEKTIEVIAQLNTLIGTLAERKEAIHPDYVKDGLKKMDDLETQTIAQIKDLLGSEVRVEALKRLEKKTYADFYSARTPAESK